MGLVKCSVLLLSWYEVVLAVPEGEWAQAWWERLKPLHFVLVGSPRRPVSSSVGWAAPDDGARLGHPFGVWRGDAWAIRTPTLVERADGMHEVEWPE